MIIDFDIFWFVAGILFAVSMFALAWLVREYLKMRKILKSQKVDKK